MARWGITLSLLLLGALSLLAMVASAQPASRVARSPVWPFTKKGFYKQPVAKPANPEKPGHAGLLNNGVPLKKVSCFGIGKRC
ncbi:hypothetical protein ONE63_003359 [Megalurothrips usitatus]|uniref:Uncharacterized protein n=1 Tax=Megalurothrips usitatus TaxID=439358 RepID=A0AAV7XAK4_9NEOP|nr:hypothetical protein ONE63_003359 [Megalurothrips usitatus]